MTLHPMKLYAVIDSRNTHSQPWIWADSLSMERKRSLDALIAFVQVLPRFEGKTREEQLRIARRWGLCVVKVRVEVVA